MMRSGWNRAWVAAIAVLAIGLAACVGQEDIDRPDQEPAPAAKGINVTVSTDDAVAEVSDKFLSFAVDTSQVVGGYFWSPDGDVEGSLGDERQDPYDFSRPRLRNLTAELSPAYLRIGGSEADVVYYDLSASPREEAPEDYDWVMTADMLDGVADFAVDLDLEIFFTVNAGPGPREGKRGPWQSANARSLIQYTVTNGYPVGVWELGNEINAFILHYGIGGMLDGAAYADDLRTFKLLVSELDPTTPAAGPSSAYWPVIGETPPTINEDFLAANGGEYADIITWHYYPSQSRRCPIHTRKSSPYGLLNPNHLDQAGLFGGEVEALRDQYAPGVPVWLGETGNAQCGGEPGVSDRYIAGLWWVDQLGLMARMGQPVVVRQTLSGSNYGMIDDDTLFPRPDYWNSVLWKRLMGARVLAADVEVGGGTVRAYAQCSASGGGAVTVLLVNLEREAAQTAVLSAFDGMEGELYLMSSKDVLGEDVELNGEVLAADENGTIPDLEGRAIADAGAITLPPLTYAFVVIPDAGAAACE